MPSKEIKALRQEGKLSEALDMARAELAASPDNIWAKRNISWVFIDYLKLNSSPGQFDVFETWLDEIIKLQMPADEEILLENLAWQIGKSLFALSRTGTDPMKPMQLFGKINELKFPKPSKGYSFLFKALHKVFKDSPDYAGICDWWNFENFLPEDYEKEKLPNGKDVMALAEQAYVAYAKQLLPRRSGLSEEMEFDEEGARRFLPRLRQLSEKYPAYQFPAYFEAKLMLAIGGGGDILSIILPFVKKKRNDFWAWELLSQAFQDDPEKVFACYCKALTCMGPEEMLVGIRQKFAKLLIGKGLFNEARTEIDLLVLAREEKSWKIPNEVQVWKAAGWYGTARKSGSNAGFYSEYALQAESLLFSDLPEQLVIVVFVNSERKILNFMTEGNLQGFFKYNRFFQKVNIGDVLRVRLQASGNDGANQAFTAVKVEDEGFRSKFLKEVNGVVRIRPGQSFGFVDDVYIHPSVVVKRKLTDGASIHGKAIRTINQEKNQMGWKLM